MLMRSFARNFPLLVVLPLLGAGVLLWANRPFGISASHDSIFYIAMAKHIAAGKGACVWMRNISTVSSPIAHYCPLYPAVMAVFFLMGMGIKTATWLLGGILFGANLAVAGAFIYRSTKSIFWGILAQFLFFFDPQLLTYHSWILTEPLFLLTTNLALLFMAGYLEKRKAGYFFWSCFFTGCAGITRYNGIAYAAAGFFCLILLDRGGRIERIKRSLLFGLLSSLPLVAWLIRNIIRLWRPGASLSEMAFADLASASAGMPISVFGYIQLSASGMMQWLSEYAFWRLELSPNIFFVCFLAIVVAVAAFFCIERRTGRTSLNCARPAAIVSTYSLAYMTFLIGHMVIPKNFMTMDARFLIYLFTYI